MVKIVGGEIVQDDDPRLNHNEEQHRQGAEASTSGSPQGTSMFDWSAPPIRVQYEAEGTGMAGMPGLVVFGLPVSSTHCLMLVAAAMFFGWRGVLVGGILWYVWARNSGATQDGAQQQSASQQQRIRAASQFFSGASPQQGQSARGGVHTLGGGAGDSVDGGAAGGNSRRGGWQGKGKAYKLSG